MEGMVFLCASRVEHVGFLRLSYLFQSPRNQPSRSTMNARGPEDWVFVVAGPAYSTSTGRFRRAVFLPGPRHWGTDISAGQPSPVVLVRVVDMAFSLLLSRPWQRRSAGERGDGGCPSCQRWRTRGRDGAPEESVAAVLTYIRTSTFVDCLCPAGERSTCCCCKAAKLQSWRYEYHDYGPSVVSGRAGLASRLFDISTRSGR